MFSGKTRLNTCLLYAALQNTFLSRHDANVTLLLMVVPIHQKLFLIQVLLQASSGHDLKRQLPESKRKFILIMYMVDCRLWLFYLVLAKNHARVSWPSSGLDVTSHQERKLVFQMLVISRTVSKIYKFGKWKMKSCYMRLKFLQAFWLHFIEISWSTVYIIIELHF